MIFYSRKYSMVITFFSVLADQLEFTGEMLSPIVRQYTLDVPTTDLVQGNLHRRFSERTVWFLNMRVRNIARLKEFLFANIC